ncbi:proline dehydrogenase [Paenibacillus selenitireducens]|uniref:proline dehydrogenase n=1 Tax=Paenibacillus selenitireducens TaxID=1324314 RepID=A0A1T2XFQ4_9BACL|nr:proline dehydrogenase family protein [Paenibacillus selenitireducens]OPA78721.1 proline dehydrogenase [Paenibacillus selenitireducens]
MYQQLFLEKQFTETLKSIARRADLKLYVERTPQLNRLLRQAASRYITGNFRQDGLEAGRKLVAKGYAISIEYIGENTTDATECEAIVAEMKALISDLGQAGISARVSFDLSHIGLSLYQELAFSHLMNLAEQVQGTDVELFISMEESSKTDDILSVYKQAVCVYPNIGITLQAHLTRTPEDLASLLSPSRIRIVKGAYQESSDYSIPRSPELNHRYLELVESAIRQGHHVSIASHDEVIMDEVLERGWLSDSKAEIEMLYGIRPDLASRMQNVGHPVRIYLPYGHEWYLYLCHRIAEFPPNLYQAVIDMVGNEEVERMQAYVERG